jgi:hypothetical protein
MCGVLGSGLGQVSELQALEDLLWPLLQGILVIPWLPDLTLCLSSLLAGE